jgi:outer membrane protein OmpA-like peptidoglycan-associated protein
MLREESLYGIRCFSDLPKSDGAIFNRDWSYSTMRKTHYLPGFALVAALAAAGCETVDPYTGQTQTSNTTQGAVIGGLAGAAIGALTNTDRAAENALIGGAVGAVAGGAIGNYMDRQEAQLRAELQRAGVSVVRQGDAIHLEMRDDILFRVNAYNLEPRAREILGGVARVLNEFRDTYVNIYGFTDTTGTREHNEQLSYFRARAVADELYGRGIDPRRLNPRGFGETNLRVQTADNVAEVRNRRVEIILEPIRR